MQDRARAQKQQPLEQGMIDGVVERGDKGHHPDHPVATGQEQLRQSQADENNADIFHGMISQQPLEIMLHQRIEHAHEGGDAADGQHGHPPLPVKLPDKVEHDTDEAVYRHLQHDPGHECGDMGGRDGMGLGQPGMQGHQPRLHAKADKHEDEGDAGPEKGQLCTTYDIEREPATEGGQHAETQQDGQAANMGHEQIEESGAPVGGILVMKGHEKIAGQGHQLPGHHKHEGVIGQHNQQHTGKEQAGEPAQDGKGVAPLLKATYVAGTVNPYSETDDSDDTEEEGGQDVETDMPVQPGQPQGQLRICRPSLHQGDQPGADRKQAGQGKEGHGQHTHHAGRRD